METLKVRILLLRCPSRWRLTGGPAELSRTPQTTIYHWVLLTISRQQQTTIWRELVPALLRLFRALLFFFYGWVKHCDFNRWISPPTGCMCIVSELVHEWMTCIVLVHRQYRTDMVLGGSIMARAMTACWLKSLDSEEDQSIIYSSGRSDWATFAEGLGSLHFHSASHRMSKHMSTHVESLQNTCRNAAQRCMKCVPCLLTLNWTRQTKLERIECRD